MNQLILIAINEQSLNSDSEISEYYTKAINLYLLENYASEWVELHHCTFISGLQ